MNIGLLGTSRGIGSAVRAELLPDLRPGTVLSAWPSRVGVFPATPVEVAMQAIGHLEAGLGAAEAGVDAVVIDSVADYGCDALAAALSLPVVGAGQAGLAAAARAGRFAIVTVWPQAMNFALDAQLSRHGLADRCRAIVNVADDALVAKGTVPDVYLRAINTAEPAIVQRVRGAIDRAVGAGAEAVMLGCTCMSPMAARVGAGASVPVINPLLEAARTAIARAAVEPGRDIRTTRAPLLRRMVDAIAGEADETCPVCVAAAAD